MKKEAVNPHRKPVSPEEKAARITQERDRLVALLASGDELATIQARVAFVLNHYPHTRNSDVALCIQYWRLFNRDDVADGDYIRLNDLYDMERSITIVRTRQKIQNEYKLFPGSEEVQDKRRARAEEQREAQIQDKPGPPITTVYCDESGKNQRHACVGGVWINNAFDQLHITQHLIVWKHEAGIEGEFHFADLSERDAPKALKFFEEALQRSAALSLKAVVVDQHGIPGSKEELFTRLYYQLCVKGIEHEVQHGRIKLPQAVNVIKDAEDASDRIALTELRQRLSTECKAYFGGQVDVLSVDSVESRISPLTQLADLLTGSLNRVLHRHPSAPRKHKDVFADELLTRLGLDPSNASPVADQDFVMVCRL